MGIYNFQIRFKAKIQARTKKHTIRAPRADGYVDRPASADHPASLMHLWTGLQTKAAERIIDPAECVRVDSIVVRVPAGCVTFGPLAEIWLGPFVEDLVQNAFQRGACVFYPEHFGLAKLDASECESLAVADGFDSYADMMAFWDERHRPTTPKRRGNAIGFYGHVFHWKG